MINGNQLDTLQSLYDAECEKNAMLERSCVEKAQKILDVTRERDNFEQAERKAHYERQDALDSLGYVKEQRNKLAGLIAIAKCPECDGSGARQFETGGCGPDGENDTREVHAEQCQWCDERAKAIAEFDDETKP